MTAVAACDCTALGVQQGLLRRGQPKAELLCEGSHLHDMT